ncbi:hypothetical protein N1851_018782 [Merluccius polli]|uniref:Uncharacterized protein n=1 Tax=Merluccius polli TaxID=89951 RepID=A0AA47MMG2_MERPO|nr:hypothetical protein N1851_018782 [Merluccius polli]
MEADVSGMKKELATQRPLRGLGGEITALQSNLLKEALTLEKPPTIDRAHRTLRSKPTQDNLPPRAFVVKCHYFSEKESLLKKAMEMKSVTTTDGDHIRILPDYTQTVSKQWAAFTEVRGLLRGCEGVRYGLRYLAILRITTADGKEASFKDPKLDKEFVLKRCTKPHNSRLKRDMEEKAMFQLTAVSSLRVHIVSPTLRCSSRSYADRSADDRVGIRPRGTVERRRNDYHPNVETDHKPLIALFQKPLNDCPCPIQRMMIRLQRYALNVAYSPGRLMYTADTLSRAADPREPANTKMEEDVNA